MTGHNTTLATGESPLTLTGEEKTVDVQWAQVAKVVKTRTRVACRMKWDYLQVKFDEERREENYNGTI